MLGGGAVAFPVPGRSCYRELPVPARLAGVVRALWVIGVAHGQDGPVSQLILPDGHGDLIVGPGSRLMAIGAAGHADRPSLTPGSCHVGARLRPGALTVLTGLRADELFDGDLSLGVLDSDDESTSGMAVALARRLIGISDQLPQGAATAQAACLLIERQVEALSIRTIADQLGVRERTLRDVFAVQVGMSPKALHQVRRLQKALALAAGNSALGLAALAVRAGYSDQAHLTRQCRALTGLTPRQLLTTVPPTKP
jgi:AraC-like DNA-binding protein